MNRVRTTKNLEPVYKAELLKINFQNQDTREQYYYRYTSEIIQHI